MLSPSTPSRRPSRRGVLACAVLLAITACSVPRIDAVAPVPAAWHAPIAPDGVIPGHSWWTMFASPEATWLVERALGDNPGLEAALARVLQAEASLRGASAAFFPTLGASSSASRSRIIGPRDRPAAGGSLGPRNSSSASGSLQASYEIDLFGGNRAAAGAAGERLAASRYDREAAAITLAADVMTGYLTVLSLRDRLRLAEERLRNAEEVLALVDTQATAGAISGLELAQQRGQVASQQASLASLRLAERQALNALAILLGQPPEGFDVAGTSLDQVRLPVVAPALPSDLLARRPDIRGAEAGIAAANFDIAAARAARFPSLSISASAAASATSIAELLGANAFTLSPVASLTAPLFQGGRLEAQEDAAVLRARELLATYTGAVLAAFRDVEDALAAVTYDAAQHGFAEEAYRQNEEAYRIAETRFRAGTVDFVTVLDAQRTLLQAQDSVIQALLARFTDTVGLVRALGGGWDGTLSPVPDLPPLAAANARAG